MAFFERRQNPPAFANPRSYMPYLRLDFRRICAYCERPESYLGGEETFEVEHFRPSSRFPEFECVYTNLYHACRGCNAHKSETWPSPIQAAQSLRFVDPCEEDPYRHMEETQDGGVV